MKKNCILR